MRTYYESQLLNGNVDRMNLEYSDLNSTLAADVSLPSSRHLFCRIQP